MVGDAITCKYMVYSPAGACTIVQWDYETGALLTGENTQLILLREGELADRGIQAYPTNEYDPDPSYSNSL